MPTDTAPLQRAHPSELRERTELGRIPHVILILENGVRVHFGHWSQTYFHQMHSSSCPRRPFDYASNIIAPNEKRSYFKCAHFKSLLNQRFLSSIELDLVVSNGRTRQNVFNSKRTARILNCYYTNDINLQTENNRTILEKSKKNISSQRRDFLF
jgi:hypothetical protein